VRLLLNKKIETAKQKIAKKREPKNMDALYCKKEKNFKKKNFFVIVK